MTIKYRDDDSDWKRQLEDWRDRQSESNYVFARQSICQRIVVEEVHEVEAVECSAMIISLFPGFNHVFDEYNDNGESSNYTHSTQRRSAMTSTASAVYHRRRPPIILKTWVGGWKIDFPGNNYITMEDIIALNRQETVLQRRWQRLRFS